MGADGGMENHLVPKEGYEIRSVTITNFHRSFKRRRISPTTWARWEHGPIKAAGGPHPGQFQPDLVVGTGGYASFPVVKEAARRHPHSHPRVQRAGLTASCPRWWTAFEL